MQSFKILIFFVFLLSLGCDSSSFKKDFVQGLEVVAKGNKNELYAISPDNLRTKLNIHPADEIYFLSGWNWNNEVFKELKNKTIEDNKNYIFIFLDAYSRGKNKIFPLIENEKGVFLIIKDINDAKWYKQWNPVWDGISTIKLKRQEENYQTEKIIP